MHNPSVGCGRITNFRNWLPHNFLPGEGSILCLEYWCNENDARWRASDSEMINQARADLQCINLIRSELFCDGYVLRVPRTYPVYTKDYRSKIYIIANWLKTIAGVTTIGRGGCHKYNNQDHSILMGLHAADNVSIGTSHNLWKTNTDFTTYQED